MGVLVWLVAEPNKVTYVRRGTKQRIPLAQLVYSVACRTFAVTCRELAIRALPDHQDGLAKVRSVLLDLSLFSHLPGCR
jgi:hypothetical protein